MNPTPINIPSSMLSGLQALCAKQVQAAVISMHLRCSATAAEQRDYPKLYNDKAGERAAAAEVRLLIRSISDPLDRLNFVWGLRLQFQQLRAERGTDARWQDYAAKVAAHRRSQEEAA